jgi:hypothetical protein
MDPDTILFIPCLDSIQPEKPKTMTPSWFSLKVGVGKGKDYVQQQLFAVLTPNQSEGDVLNPFAICAASFTTAKISPTLKFAEVSIHEGVLKSDNARMEGLKCSASALRVSFPVLFNHKKVKKDETLMVTSSEYTKHIGR